MASYPSVNGGNSRTPGSPARPFCGCTDARSNTVGPTICHTPLQSGSAVDAGLVACPAATPIALTHTAAARRAVLIVHNLGMRRIAYRARFIKSADAEMVGTVRP